MSSVSALAFSGTLFFGLLDSNKSLESGYRKAGEVYPFSLQVTTKQSTKPSAMKGSFGQTKHTRTTIDTIAGSATFHEAFAAVFAWALAGEETAMTGSGGSVTDESVTLISDEWVKLANKGVSEVVITGSVLDTDYAINGDLGLIRMIPGGNLTAAATDVSYTYAAEAGYQVKIGTNAQIRVAILLDGENLETGEDITAEFYSVVLATNAEINLVMDPDSDFDTMAFDLTFETPDDKTTPGVINGIPLQYFSG